MRSGSIWSEDFISQSASSPPGSYLKKIIEDAGNVEETGQLVRYCSWENPTFSSMVLTELLWQISYSYNYELRPYLDLLLQVLLIDDSWQTQRILNALKVSGGVQRGPELGWRGAPEPVEGGDGG